MNHTLKRISVITAALALVILITGAVLLLYSPVPEKSEFHVTLEELRILSGQEKEKFPDSINALDISDSEFPSGSVVAGFFSPLPMPCYVWQISYSGNKNKSIIVDTAQHEKHMKGFISKGTFHKKEYDMMQEALKNAESILLTHEHLDHTGGAVMSPYLNKILPKMRITPEQKTGRSMADARFSARDLEKMPLISYDRVIKFAPGVVLIKTPGHTPGSQSLYVRLANGKEFILAGDIAWSMLNINIPKGRPWLTSIVLRENRTATANQLRWLNDLQKQGLTILITHDKEQVIRSVEKGLIKIGFDY